MGQLTSHTISVLRFSQPKHVWLYLFLTHLPYGDCMRPPLVRPPTFSSHANPATPYIQHTSLPYLLRYAASDFPDFLAGHQCIMLRLGSPTYLWFWPVILSAASFTYEPHGS